MSEDANLSAAEYALGLVRGDARAAFESRLEDPALRSKIDFWEERLAALDLAGAPEAPEADLFDAILARFDAADSGRGALRPDVISGTLTRRAGAGAWVEIAPGVEQQILFDNHKTKRRSMLLRLAPGAFYESHAHQGGDEECLVLEGDIDFGACKLGAGDFHVALAGSVHPAAQSIGGCLLHISAPL